MARARRTPGHTVTPGPTPPRHLLAILLLVAPMSQIPLDIYTPALPQMVADLGSTSAVMQNTVTAYMLGMSVAFVPVGIVADALGRKRVLLTCLVVVGATSVLCAVADSVPLLLGLRFVQGAAASACLVLAVAMAADSFRGDQLTSVSGLLGVAWGLAPVLAPAVGGVLVQFVEWRVVFVLIAAMSSAVAVVVAAALPETLAADQRSPIHVGQIGRSAAEALRNRVFLCVVLVFGLMASAQLAFGVAGPFLYQDGLGLVPAAYGLLALIVGMANLGGELACGLLATRVSARTLAIGALAVFAAGAAVLVVSAATIGLSVWAITLGAGLALAGCGVLCPQMYGLALGLFTRNLGLIGGMVSAGGYLIVSASMAAVGALPERSQAPLGWLYVTCGLIAFVPLMWATSARHSRVNQQATPTVGS